MIFYLKHPPSLSLSTDYLFLKNDEAGILNFSLHHHDDGGGPIITHRGPPFIFYFPVNIISTKEKE
jgi:hypothetical protein